MPAKLPQLIRKLFCSADATLSFDEVENTRFLPIDAGPCREVLGLSIDHLREPLEQYLLPDEPICERGSAELLGVPFPSGSIAGCLDRLLWASEPDLRDRLNALAANLTETFARARDEEMKNRDRALAAFDARPEVEGGEAE
jgi:hypothetical protein